MTDQRKIEDLIDDQERRQAVAGPVQPTVAQRLYEPWNASLKTKKTHNIGIYNRVGELVATLDVHQCATEATQKRRMREAQMMAAAPDLVAAVLALKEAGPLGQRALNAAADMLDAALAKAGVGAA
jgi:hypothetical protein